VVGAGGIVAEEVLDAEAGLFGHDASPWRVYSLRHHSLKGILCGLFARQDHYPIFYLGLRDKLGKTIRVAGLDGEDSILEVIPNEA
jgi:hypothetical protein